MAKEVEITAEALSDMRDVLLRDMGIVAAEYATDEAIVKKIKKVFGLENWLRQYGYGHLIP